MKTISNIIKFAGSTGLLVGLLIISTLPAYAVPATENTSGACTRIATLGDTSNATISGHIATMNNDFAARTANIANRSTTIDPKVDATRAKATQTFDTKITKIEAQTGLTAVQKTALETYLTNMHTAETTREAAVDAARTTYRTDLVTTVKTHQTNLTAAITTYQNSVSAAFTTAGANCGDGTAMATLKTSVKAARDTLKTARTDTKVAATIHTLITTRNTAIQAADTNFTQSAATYTSTLSAILEATPATTNS